MNIVYVFSEQFPFSKTGGLGDIAASLPKFFAREHNVVTVTPFYSFMDKEALGIEEIGMRLEFCVDKKEYEFDVYMSKHDGLTTYFLHNSYFFNRKEMYGSYLDNYLRFGIFCYGVIELVKYIDFEADIYHVNDWQTSLIPLLLKEKYANGAKLVLTIHNLSYQGIATKKAMKDLDIDWNHFNMDKVEFYDHFNFLKTGIFFSDAFTTVSDSYAQEIQTKEYGCGISDFIKTNANKLHGILNGIDYDEWDTKKDKFLLHKYDAKTLDKKLLNKIELCKEFNLKDAEGRPLFILISRLVKQKGVDFLLENYEFLKALEANFFILGDGDNENIKKVKETFDFSDNFVTFIGYNEELAHRLYASADFLMMPSLYEPCGLNQLIALRYGAVPIVRATGGLKETIADYTLEKQDSKGRGIVFESPDGFSFMVALMRAFSLFANRNKYVTLVEDNMQCEFDWCHSAQKYELLYKTLVGAVDGDKKQ